MVQFLDVGGVNALVCPVDIMTLLRDLDDRIEPHSDRGDDCKKTSQLVGYFGIRAKTLISTCAGRPDRFEQFNGKTKSREGIMSQGTHDLRGPSHHLTTIHQRSIA